MRRVSHIRNLIISIAVVVAIFLTSNLSAFPPNIPDVAAAPLQQAGNFSWTTTSIEEDVIRGDFVIFDELRLRNNTGEPDLEFALNVTGGPTNPPWTITYPPSITLDSGTTGSVAVVITVPSNAAIERRLLTVRATRTDLPNYYAETLLVVNVKDPPTTTPTASPTTGPTPTDLPICQGGTPRSDPGNDMAGAQLILVDVLESHGICTIGDEDWFKFGAVGGKVYTIDIPRMDNGLDLSLDLYDSDGNLLASNDDYFNRPASTPGAGPYDIRPQIDSWRAPRDGIYYFRVRDTLNLGGDDTTYDVIVRSESYGPTPATVPLVCQDIYEPDGLPENATLIGPNEIQTDHRLCPAGDADWVRFFGKAGKTYYLYTDTRPYNRDNIGNRDPINPPSQAGADTVLYLADRDGITILDFSDDIPGSLDSEIRFVPPADGFYYAQIKNTGDLGNQFIRYDFALKLCVPGEECGRSPIDPAAQPTPAATTTTAPTPTPTLDIDFITETEEAAEDMTAEAEETSQAETEDALFLQQSAASGQLINGPIRGFADSAFGQVWQRTDRPLAEQRVTRSWLWGPRGLMARSESYLQAEGGLRQVQYFDKGRMEVNNPRGDRSSNWFVTTGLLIIEMISGKTQLGDNEFVQNAPANIPIAGDPNDPNAPTYASFSNVIALAPGDRTGQIPNQTIDRAGRVGQYNGPNRPETRLVQYVPESGHNIPQVFWDYLNSQGLVYEQGSYRTGKLFDWVFTLGYPISEPYWARVKVGGVERDVLIQPFQRRVLTYSPDNPAGWQVEMGNVGRHYYRWRYGEELPAP